MSGNLFAGTFVLSVVERRFLGLSYQSDRLQREAEDLLEELGQTGTGRALRLSDPGGDLEIHGEPAWMPDGQSILLSAAAPPDAAHALEGGEIYAVRVATGERRQITRHPGPDEAPAPSPDASLSNSISKSSASSARSAKPAAPSPSPPKTGATSPPNATPPKSTAPIPPPTPP